MVTGVIQAYLAKRLPPSPAWRFTLAELAAAALMVECAEADTEFAPEERDVIYAAVREQFGFDAETSQSLIEVAEQRAAEVLHDWLFLEAVKQGFSEGEQRELLERLFGVAIDAERGDLRLHDVTLRLQRCLFAYETSVMKSQASLEGALREVTAIAEQAMPRVHISDHHEFIRLHETQNMLLTAELFLTASLLRKETRSDHFREDYPEPDPTWLKWIVFNRGLEAGHRIEALPWPNYRRQPEHLQQLSEGPA